MEVPKQKSEINDLELKSEETFTWIQHPERTVCKQEMGIKSSRARNRMWGNKLS